MVWHHVKNLKVTFLRWTNLFTTFREATQPTALFINIVQRPGKGKQENFGLGDEKT